MKKKILIIEDDVSNAKLMMEILGRRNYDLSHAEDAMTGLKMASDDPPDLILLDIDLPDLDGKVVASRLKHIVRTRHSPIVAVTGDATPRTERLAIAYGCDAVIHKPFDIWSFPQQIAAYLDPSEVS